MKATSALLVGFLASIVDARADAQLRLAYHGDGSMMVSWNTFERAQTPTVRWGSSPDSLTNVATSNISITYDSSTTYNNHVVINGLNPGTTYYYRPSPVSDKNDEKAYNFTTSRSIGDQTPFSLAIVGDLGTMGYDGLTTTGGRSVPQNTILKPGEKNTVDSLTSELDTYDFLWHLGDIAYADYWLKEEIQGFLPNTTVQEGHKVYEMMLNDFYDQMMPVTAYKPYMVGPGNHDANCDDGGTHDVLRNITYDSSFCPIGQTNFTGLQNHFRMPADISGGTGNFWYSFDHGMVHFVQLDTETDLGHGLVGPDEVYDGNPVIDGHINATLNAQSDWLETDLAAVDRSKTPWIVVAGHRPMYLSKNLTGLVCFDCKDIFEPILLKHHVDLYVSGHCHAYERMTAIANNEIDPSGLNNPKAPWYITNGAAGHYEGLSTLPAKKLAFSEFALDRSNATYGWSRLTFHNCTHLTHEFVASNNNTVLDSATLFKDRQCGPGASSTGPGNPSQSAPPLVSGTTRGAVPGSVVMLAMLLVAFIHTVQ